MAEMAGGRDSRDDCCQDYRSHGNYQKQGGYRGRDQGWNEDGNQRGNQGGSRGAYRGLREMRTLDNE